MPTVPVETIEQGEYFRKINGSFAYLRMSDSSAKFYKLDYQKYVFGICYNGNVASIEHGKFVHKADRLAMIANEDADEEWNVDICGHPPMYYI